MELLSNIESKILTIRNQKVILDYDLAILYQVETRDINKAVKNNPEKFPAGYILELDNQERTEVVENFHHLKHLKFNPNKTKAFTERGLYMLATILKSKQATQTTLAIVDTFSKLKELSRNLALIPDAKEQSDILKHSGELLHDILNPNFPVSGTETSLELNLAILKIKHTIERKKS